MTTSKTQTSGGIPLTRARLIKALGHLPVEPAYAARDRPFCWRIEFTLDWSRHRHPFNQMDDADWEADRAPVIEEVARALAAAGYHVTLRHVPDDAMLAGLSPALREQMADIVPTLQVMIVPDPPTER